MNIPLNPLEPYRQQTLSQELDDLKQFAISDEASNTKKISVFGRRLQHFFSKHEWLNNDKVARKARELLSQAEAHKEDYNLLKTWCDGADQIIEEAGPASTPNLDQLKTTVNQYKFRYLRMEDGGFLHTYIHGMSPNEQSTAKEQYRAYLGTYTEKKSLSKTSQVVNQYINDIQGSANVDQQKALNDFKRSSDATINVYQKALAGYDENPYLAGHQAKKIKEYFDQHPDVAKGCVEAAKQDLAALKQAMKKDFTKTNVTNVGRTTMNKWLLCKPEYRSHITTPSVINALIALESLGQGDAAYAELNRVDSGTMSGAFYYGITGLHPKELAIIPPNSNRYDDLYLEHSDEARKAADTILQIQDNMSITMDDYSLDFDYNSLTSSAFDEAYDPTQWKAHAQELRYIAEHVLPETDDAGIQAFVAKYFPNRPDLKGWSEPSLIKSTPRGILESKTGFEMLLKRSVPEETSYSNFTREELVEQLAKSTLWLEPQTHHLALDPLHLASIFLFGSRIDLELKDGNISARDLILEVADYLGTTKIVPKNAIAAEALFARMCMLKDKYDRD